MQIDAVVQLTRQKCPFFSGGRLHKWYLSLPGQKDLFRMTDSSHTDMREDGRGTGWHERPQEAEKSSYFTHPAVQKFEENLGEVKFGSEAETSTVVAGEP